MPTNNIEIRIANIQWWTIFGAAFFSVGMFLIFLSYSSLYILPTVPYNSSSSVLLLSGQTLIVGIVGTCLGLLIMLTSKFRLARLNLTENPNRQRK